MTANAWKCDVDHSHVKSNRKGPTSTSQEHDGDTSFRKLVQTLAGLLSPCAFGHATRDLDMFVHGDDFIVAGDGDDFDRLSLKLNEKLELVQKARLGPGYDSEATVLNRFAWEA